MKKVGRFSVALGLVVSSGALLSYGLIGCSGDDNVVPGVDAATDATTDVVVVPDTGTPDANDGGSTDAKPDVKQLSYDEFVNQQSVLLCQRYAQCCFGADAAVFDTTKCLAAVGPYGIEDNVEGLRVPGVVFGVDGGPDGGGVNLVLDQVKANACLAEVANVDCPTVTAAVYGKTVQDCYGAVIGTLATGKGPCRDSVECAPGNFCGPTPNDAGVRTCTPLLQLGQTCNGSRGNTACQYRGYLGAQSRCEILVAPDGGAPSNVCTPRLPNGGPCYNGFDCQSELCDFGNNFCTSSAVTIGPASCAYFKKDGG